MNYKILLSVFMSITALSLQAQSLSTTTSMSEYFEALTKSGQFNGVVLVKQGDSIKLLRAFNAEDTPSWAKVDIDSQFHIASVRKLLNQYIIYQLSESEYLNTPITELIKHNAIHPKWTPKVLLAHRSGLPRGEKFDFDSSHYTAETLLSLIEKQSLLFEPDTDFMYSNFGHLLLDLTNTAKYKVSVSQVMQQLIFSPLGMNNTIEINRSNAAIELNGMWFENSKPMPVELTSFKRFPTGDVFSTVHDLDKFLRALDLKKFDIDDGIIEHAGAKQGYRSYVYYDANSELSFVMLSNHGDMPITQNIKDVKQLISGEAVTLPKKIKRTRGHFQADLASQITGQYKLLINQQMLSIECENGKLFLLEQTENNPPSKEPLYFESERVLFFSEGSSDSLLIQGDRPPYQLVVTGYGNMEFSLTRLSEGKGCVK